jgi:uncharacterized protein (DUF488 family)
MRPIYTIGHSTHPLDEFIAMLKAHGIATLVDIRAVPKSRRNPQFAKEALAAGQKKAEIAYVHMRELGGLRHPRKDSMNTAWQNDSFRGYADYMQTAEFESALEKLILLSAESNVAIMCAEALPWRCHRSLVADALTARGVEVRHIMSATSWKPHSITAWARVEGTHVSYPGVT